MHMPADATSSPHGFRSEDIKLLAKARSAIGKYTGASSQLAPNTFYLPDFVRHFYGFENQDCSIIMLQFPPSSPGKEIYLVQGPCGWSPKRRGSLRCLPPLEVRPSSVAPDPAESRGAPPPPQDPSPLRGTLESSLRSPAKRCKFLQRGPFI